MLNYVGYIMPSIVILLFHLLLISSCGSRKKNVASGGENKKVLGKSSCVNEAVDIVSVAKKSKSAINIPNGIGENNKPCFKTPIKQQIIVKSVRCDSVNLHVSQNQKPCSKYIPLATEGQVKEDEKYENLQPAKKNVNKVEDKRGNINIMISKKNKESKNAEELELQSCKNFNDDNDEKNDFEEYQFLNVQVKIANEMGGKPIRIQCDERNTLGNQENNNSIKEGDGEYEELNIGKSADLPPPPPPKIIQKPKRASKSANKVVGGNRPSNNKNVNVEESKKNKITVKIVPKKATNDKKNKLSPQKMAYTKKK
uniref:Uncharacterized protein n=1 Tax=Strongyloides venezuelensis TaxID=75913 RepID=A0A0K0FNE2_STRVS